jgi:hypothetical protein
MFNPLLLIRACEKQMELLEIKYGAPGVLWYASGSVPLLMIINDDGKL